MQTGKIVKATGGFYYVDLGEETIECRARGIFRKKGITPYVGDFVEVSFAHEGGGSIDHILERKNNLVRPPVANLDYMVVVVSATDPVPNYVTLDKFLATLASHSVPAILAVTKTDLADSSALVSIYRQVGYAVFPIQNQTGEGIQAMLDKLDKSFCAFAGNSGVGKSTLLNTIAPNLNLAVGDTSKKLGRGRHTTRHVEIHTLPSGLSVADTPGFSSLDLLQTGDIRAGTLPDYFIEFERFAQGCKFRDCRHIAETDCAVHTAAEAGAIPPSRYQSYLTIYNEIKDVKEWESR